MINIVADLHTHTIACGHGYSTIREIAEEASLKKLKMIAITEHGPAHDPKGTQMMFFETYRDVPDTIYGVRILKGCEANVVSMDGALDIPEKILACMDIVIASFHSSTTPKGTVEENTARMIGAMKNKFVDIIGHPDRGYPIDAEAIVKAATSCNTALEANNSSQAISSGSNEQLEKILFFAKKYGAMISLGSDAHSQYKAGDVSAVLALIEKAGIGEEQILNTSTDKIINFLKRNNNKKLLK